MAAGLGPFVTSSAAAPASATCVAVIVDGTALGGSVSTGCDRNDPHATGVDVLNAAGYTVTFRGDGLLCTINGQPSSGCAAVDNTHYWAYYHRRPGSTSWSYSNEGPATYQPADGSTEGWVYRDGPLIAPTSVPYSQICGATKNATTPKPHRASPTPGKLPGRLPTHSARPLPPRPSPSVTHHVKATLAPRPGHHLTGTPTPYESLTASPPARRVGSPTPAATASGGGHGGVIGAVVAAVIVIGLGSAAVVSNRRRRT